MCCNHFFNHLGKATEHSPFVAQNSATLPELSAVHIYYVRLLTTEVFFFSTSCQEVHISACCHTADLIPPVCMYALMYHVTAHLGTRGNVDGINTAEDGGCQFGTERIPHAVFDLGRGAVRSRWALHRDQLLAVYCLNGGTNMRRMTYGSQKCNNKIQSGQVDSTKTYQPMVAGLILPRLQNWGQLL